MKASFCEAVGIAYLGHGGTVYRHGVHSGQVICISDVLFKKLMAGEKHSFVVPNKSR